MLNRRSLLALALVAAAWSIASSATVSAKRSDPAETACAAAPSAPEAVVAGDRLLPESGAGGVVPAARAEIAQPALVATTTSSSARQSVLIEVQVLEKYRSFRESLSCP